MLFAITLLPVYPMYVLGHWWERCKERAPVGLYDEPLGPG
jgi:hypothetical protein